MRRDPATACRSRRRSVAFALVAAIALAVYAAAAGAQTSLVRGKRLAPDAPVKVFFPAGSIRVSAWDRDSIDVRGRMARGEHFFLEGDSRGVKMGVMDHADGRSVRPSDLVVRVPRSSMLSIKSVSAAVVAMDVSGWFYSVSGAIHLSGHTGNVEVESLGGDVDVDVAAPWVRARTGDGQLVIRGAPEDLDAATVRGPLDVESGDVSRGRFSSVQGDIHFAGTLAPDGLLDFSNHSGAVELVLPRATAATLDLSSVTGPIENGFTQVRAAGGQVPSQGSTLHLQLGSGGPHVTVRTFRGTIRLRPR